MAEEEKTENSDKAARPPKWPRSKVAEIIFCSVGSSPLKPNASNIISKNKGSAIHLCDHGLCVPARMCSDSGVVEFHYIIRVTWYDNCLVAPPQQHHRQSIRVVVTIVARTAPPCPPHHLVHLSRPRPSQRNQRQQRHNSLHTHSLPANSPNSRPKHPARTKAGRSPKPASLPQRHARTGP